MGIFESIKNAFGKSDAEPEAVVPPSQLLREAGIDPSNLQFRFGNREITVIGEIQHAGDRQKIVDTLSGLSGIDTVHDQMTVAPPAKPEAESQTPPEANQVEAAQAESAPHHETAEKAQPETEEKDADEGEGRTYTVESGDTLWKISEEMYGDGSKYMKIYEANTDILDDPDRIYPGQELKIPD